MANEYRRRKGFEKWHWCRNCSNWPMSNYEAQQTEPTSGKLDEECQALDEEGECR